jgi:hypothetical protein
MIAGIQGRFLVVDNGTGFDLDALRRVSQKNPIEAPGVGQNSARGGGLCPAISMVST